MHRYQIEERIGRGGMGIVYRARHVHIGKVMAIKVLQGDLARRPDIVARFRREADAISRLSNPNTVQVFDFGSTEGLMYLVMEFCEGKNLGQMIRDAGELDFKTVARVGAQVCSSLEEAHQLGIVHRDLKPENIMVRIGEDKKPVAKVLDFGLVKLRENSAGITLTRAGAILGTPYYMSPEQIRGEEIDARSDVYSIGAMMYKAVTGKAPFSASTPMGVLTKSLTDPLVPPSDRVPTVPTEADAIIARAMEKDASDRYPSAAALEKDLQAFLASRGESMTPDRPSISAVRKRDRGLATRAEVERYERSIKRRGWLSVVVSVLLLAGIAGGAAYAYQQHLKDNEVLDHEVEPNNIASTANRLPPNHPTTGHLGRRRTATEGDIDVYTIRNEAGSRAVISFGVTGIPNIDVIVELFRRGHQDPLRRANSAGVGEGERVPNFPINGREYQLLVRELWVDGQPPTENISDPYTIDWRIETLEPGSEREFNDMLEVADVIEVGTPKRGFIGWNGDKDAFCLASDSGSVHAELSGIPGMDLMLTVVSRLNHDSRRIDNEGIGGAEQSDPVDGREGDTCFEVQVDRNEENTALANAEATYTLTLVSETAGASEADGEADSETRDAEGAE